jgi:hypothetical protein
MKSLDWEMFVAGGSACPGYHRPLSRAGYAFKVSSNSDSIVCQCRSDAAAS